MQNCFTNLAENSTIDKLSLGGGLVGVQHFKAFNIGLIGKKAKRLSHLI